MNPIAALHIANDRNIVTKLLPESAPNIMNSFIYTASRGYLNHHTIKRIVPGDWVDVNYMAFGKKECRYLIPSEFELNPDVIPLNPHSGAVCTDGYGGAGLAGCESFFPLRDCLNHRGICPVFDRVPEGVDELYRLKKVETVPATDFPIEGVEVNRPVKPGIIEWVELELHGEIYPEPVKVREPELPECWK